LARFSNFKVWRARSDLVLNVMQGDWRLIELYYREVFGEHVPDPNTWGPQTRNLILRTAWRNNTERHWLHRRLVSAGVSPEVRREMMLLRRVDMDLNVGWVPTYWTKAAAAAIHHDISKVHRHIDQMDEQARVRDPKYFGWNPSSGIPVNDWLARPEPFGMNT
jgi:hypothetical protein